MSEGDRLRKLWAVPPPPMEKQLFGVTEADREAPSIRLPGYGQAPRALTRRERLESWVRRKRDALGWSLRRLGAWVDGGNP